MRTVTMSERADAADEVIVAGCTEHPGTRMQAVIEIEGIVKRVVGLWCPRCGVTIPIGVDLVLGPRAQPPIRREKRLQFGAPQGTPLGASDIPSPACVAGDAPAQLGEFQNAHIHETQGSGEDRQEAEVKRAAQDGGPAQEVAPGLTACTPGAGNGAGRCI